VGHVGMVSLIDNILNETLKNIIPTNAEIELIKIITKKLHDLLEQKAKELGINFTKIEPQGSTGIKQTQLKDDFDIDLFIGLDYNEYKPKYQGLSKGKLKKESKKDFLDLCNKWIIKSLTLREFSNPRLLYAEHPYVTVDYTFEQKKIKIDIVLYFDLELEVINHSGPITAVDRSPWHGRFIRDELTRKQKNDVRLLKQIFKSSHSYGDKSAVGKVGFIGYSAELLIYYFKDLINLLNNFKDLNKAPLDYYGRNIKQLRKISHFQDDSLIIIDPVDKNRNVASAISEKSFKYCNHRISEFLKNPDPKFFEVEPISEVDLSNKEDPILKKIFILEFENSNKDIHYTINRDKLYSLGERIIKNGEKEPSHDERFSKILFEVYFEDDLEHYNLAIYCDKPHISETFFRKGPPVKEKTHANNFMRKNPSYFEKEGYLWVEKLREYKDFMVFLHNFIQKKIPENLKIINISNSLNVRTSSGKKTIKILKTMVIPFYI
jgi:tRNA nucleotidyltransferase (CCA-adding enzyme)